MERRLHLGLEVRGREIGEVDAGWVIFPLVIHLRGVIADVITHAPSGQGDVAGRHGRGARVSPAVRGTAESIGGIRVVEDDVGGDAGEVGGNRFIGGHRHVERTVGSTRVAGPAVE